MTNYDFGMLLRTDKNPTLDMRERVIRNNLTDWRHEGGYLRVHKVAVTSPGEFYACVSYPFASSTIQTYVAGTIQCRRKTDGYWLQFECFLATASVPFLLTGCPRVIFEAGKAMGITSKVDDDWYQACMQNQLIRDKEEAVKKGAVFKLQAGAPSPVLGGERAAFAVIHSKSKVLYVSPGSRLTLQGSVEDLLDHYEPVDANSIPVMLDKGRYTEVGELLFDITGNSPVLKGRLAKGAKAKLLAKVRLERDRALRSPIVPGSPVSVFSTGAWLD